MLGTAVDASRYPALAAERYWPWGRQHVEFRLLDDVPDALVASVNLVPFEADRIVLAHVDGGSWELPGGTREPGEAIDETARRELLEEAGAVLDTFAPFGGWFCRSEDEQPYRPHLPHPEFWRLVAIAEVRRTQAPIPAPGAELIDAVESLRPDDAIARLTNADVAASADLLRLALDLRSSR